ncbi:hypothetical protein A5747_09410 [Mycobacterium sp. IS-836]|uniref:hypothetical protein n=1 Tax=Mycobacterium sp. IS-836 TaxID=1834160 RepID=UPI00096D6634|nr:hypothetical protein [Mycobacterium sp. IS-836]OMC56252.1 hypothetical protein A5747_09410 [Mycobacterium sp. IS-836]
MTNNDVEDSATVIQPPERVVLDHPGVVRFAAGRQNGPRSHTWRVAGVTNASGHDDIYVGTRRGMHAVKISLHDAKPPKYPEPATVFAWDERGPDGDQLTRKMSLCLGRTVPVIPGWRHELEILTPTTTFGSFSETPPLGPGEVIQWWTPPPYPEQLSFHLYVGDANSLIPTVGNHIGDVCQMQLSSGRRLWIVAQSTPMADSVAQAIQQHVASLPTDPKFMHPFTLYKEGSGAPVLLDLAATYRPQ